MTKKGGFHHVAMRVKDFEKVVEFYTQGLGYSKGIYWGDGESRAQMIDLEILRFLHFVLFDI